MARPTSKTSSSKINVATENNSVATQTIEDNKNNQSILPLDEEDIIICTAQIANMSYKDHKTGDRYTWNNIGDVEEISFGVLKDMYRNYGSYIKNLWFTIEDERVIKKFHLEKLYNNYKSLIEAKSYTKNNLKELKNRIEQMPRGIVNTVISKVKAFVAQGEISDIRIIREMERILDVDLINLIE